MEPVWTGHYSAKIFKAARDSNRRSLLLEATTRPTCSMSWAWSYKRKCSAYNYAMLVWSTVIGWKILNGQSERSKLADRQFTWKFFFIGLSPGIRQTNNHWKWIIFKIKKNILENSFFCVLLASGSRDSVLEHLQSKITVKLKARWGGKFWCCRLGTWSLRAISDVRSFDAPAPARTAMDLIL